METPNYNVICGDNHVPIKAWTKGVPFADRALEQLKNIASLNFVHGHIAVMPDVHVGKGATIGSVIPSTHAIIPAAVGVDIGCGMMAVQTTLTAEQLPADLSGIRGAIEAAVPHGRSSNRSKTDRGAWGQIPELVAQGWQSLADRFATICTKHPEIKNSNHQCHLGTLGTGNHFLELCIDDHQHVWIMLHSGSRGVGNKIGSYFINLAKHTMGSSLDTLPDPNLAYFKVGTPEFDDYLEAVGWAQDFARINREIMMTRALQALGSQLGLDIELGNVTVNCHHNYVALEHHFGHDCYVTRKGAVRVQQGELGIIPGSMGAKSFIVRGLGNAESFHSCSHGAGRVMSRTQAKKTFTLGDQIAATQGVECRKDTAVIDEIPHAYKNIDDVMNAQQDLVEILYTLKQVVCVKG